MLTLGGAVLVVLLVVAGPLHTESGESGRDVASRSRRSTTSSAPSTTTAPTTSTSPPTTPATTAAPATTAPPPSTAAPTTAAPAGTPLDAVKGRTIVIDPGHNGLNYLHPEINQLVDIGTQKRACDTTGTQTNDGFTESAYNLDVALRLAAMLRQAGANVVMTRSDNNGWGPCITERAAIGNRAHADVGISIHADGGPASGRGFHVISPADIPGLTSPIYDNSKRLAHDVHDAFAASTPMPVANYIGLFGYAERSDLGGLNLSTVPKVFIETGNMRNGVDAGLLESPTFRQQAATAIAGGLASYLAGR